MSSSSYRRSLLIPNLLIGLDTDAYVKRRVAMGIMTVRQAEEYAAIVEMENGAKAIKNAAVKRKLKLTTDY